jgi:hypothetical protein
MEHSDPKILFAELMISKDYEAWKHRRLYLHENVIVADYRNYFPPPENDETVPLTIPSCITSNCSRK